MRMIHPVMQNLWLVLPVCVAALLLAACGGSSSKKKATDSEVVKYTIGGSVRGLVGTVVLRNSTGEVLSVVGSSAFRFKTEVAKGGEYSVSVVSQPSGYGCIVSSGSGTVESSDVENIDVQCVADNNPNGYYKAGTLSFVGSVDDSNVQAMVHNKRLLLVSFKNDVLYEAIMEINGTEFSSEAFLYQNGIAVARVPMEGVIVERSKIVGILNGTGAGNGAFVVHYSDTNITNPADVQLTHLETDVNNPSWEANVGGSTTPYSFRLSSAEFVDLGALGAPVDGTFANCRGNGSVEPLSGTALYQVKYFEQTACTTQGLSDDVAVFNVLTTTQSVTNEKLLFIGTMPGFAIYGEFE